MVRVNGIEYLGVYEDNGQHWALADNNIPDWQGTGNIYEEVDGTFWEQVMYTPDTSESK